MFSNAKVLLHLLKGGKGNSHAERLEDFYGPQADHYDSFREKLLHGRQELIDAIPLEDGDHLVEIGGGTGRNLEFFGDRITKAGCVEVVDLCRPLLEVAKKRIEAKGWTDAHAVHADATAWKSEHGPIDACYFSYSLSMIPDWFAALDNAIEQVKPGGHVGVVDFYISRKHPAEGRTKHGRFKRFLWPHWFAHDGVILRPDLLPYLESKLEEVTVLERYGRVPYVPLGKVPHLVFVGKKKA